jgi:hypothetical protein
MAPPTGMSWREQIGGQLFLRRRYLARPYWFSACAEAGPAVCDALDVLGVNFGQRLALATKDSEKGYWEHSEIVALHADVCKRGRYVQAT